MTLGKFFIKIVLISLLLITTSNAFTATIYVAKTGSNSSGNGSISNPYQTISYALDSSSGGDTIIIKGGTYDEAVRIRNANITLQAYSNETVIISTPINNEEIDTTITIDVDADYTTLKNLEITGGYYYAVMLWTRWDWGDPDDRTGVSHITIENCTIHDTGRDCVKITPNCDYVTIKNCEIYNSGQRYDENAEGIDNVNGDFMVVKDCYIHDTATTGVYAKGGASDVVIERNIIRNCGMFGVGIGFDTSPEYFDLTVNPDRYENIRGTVKNCLIENTDYAGIAFYAALDSVAYNNTIINTAKIAHSPIYFGVTLQDWEPDSDPNDGYGYRPASKNIEVYNNIIQQDTNLPTEVVFIRTFYHESTGRVNGYENGEIPEMDNNCYYLNGNAPLFTDQRPDYNIEDMSFQQWQTHISGDLNTITVNPQLDNSGKLTSSSPCINNGNGNVTVTVDLDGNNRDNQIDIGAYEYVSGEEPPASDEEIYYIPHVAHNNYTTYLNVYNPNSNQLNYTVYYYNSNGSLTLKRSYTTNGYNIKSIEISNLTGGTVTYAKIGVTSGDGIFKISYFNTDGGMAEFTVEKNTYSKLIYTFPSYNDEITWNGIACMNTSDNNVQITIKAYLEGINTITETRTLNSFNNLVDLIGDEGSILTSLGLHDYDMVVITTSNPVLCGLNISGSGQEKLIFSKAVN